MFFAEGEGFFGAVGEDGGYCSGYLFGFERGSVG